MTVTGTRQWMKKWSRDGGFQPLSWRRRAAKELPALFQSPSRPFCENKGTAARERREKAGRGATTLNSKFGTNNADPCFVSPWEINASASAGLIAPYTPNSNNIYLRRGAVWHGTAWSPRGLMGAANAIGFDVCASDRSATRKKRRFSPVNRIARCVAPHTLCPLVLFITCEILRWRARACYAAIVKL